MKHFIPYGQTIRVSNGVTMLMVLQSGQWLNMKTCKNGVSLMVKPEGVGMHVTFIKVA